MRERIPISLNRRKMYYSETTSIYLDGQWLQAGDAKVSLYSQSMHYGSDVFEGIRSCNVDGAFFTETAAEVAGIGWLDGSPFKLAWEDKIGYQISRASQNMVRQTIRKSLASA